jgi:hypothetical protein
MMMRIQNHIQNRMGGTISLPPTSPWSKPGAGSKKSSSHGNKNSKRISTYYNNNHMMGGGEPIYKGGK